MVEIIYNIRNVCRKKLVLPVIISFIMLAVLFVCPFYLIFHPENINDINKVSAKQQYVNVHAETLYYTGYNLIKTFDREYGYYYSLNDKQCIFVLIPIDNNPARQISNYTFKGKIVRKNSSYNKMLEAFCSDLGWNKKDLSQFSTDFIISNADYTPVRYAILLWITLCVLLLSLKKIISSILGIVNPYLYPVCTFLGKKEQKQLIDNAQNELLSDNYLQINSMYITENYFIDLEKSYVSIIPLKDIIWCYRVGELRLNPYSTSPDYSLCFTIKSGSVITDRHKTSDEALELLNAIRATEYDIITGHSESKQREAKARLKGQL